MIWKYNQIIEKNRFEFIISIIKKIYQKVKKHKKFKLKNRLKFIAMEKN